MKKYILFLSLFSFSITSSAFLSSRDSSNSNKKKSFIRLASINLVGEVYANNESFGGYDKMLSHSPSYSFLKSSDRNRFTIYKNKIWSQTIQLPSIYFTFTPFNKSKKEYNYKKELRFGVSIIDQQQKAFGMDTSYYKADTLYSTGLIYREEIFYIATDLSYLYKTNPEKIVSVYTGLGMKAGVSFDDRIVRSEVYDTINVKIYNRVDSFQFRNRTDFKSTSHPISSSFLIQPYIPFGVNVRFAKNKRILKNISFALEGRVGINYQHFQLGKDYINPFASISSRLCYWF